MLFNSFDFALFLPFTFFIYWFVVNKNLRLQNLFIVLASYVFYSFWDWRFLSIMVLSTLLDYSVGLGLFKSENQNKRRWLLWISLLLNLGALGFFKYYNFFLDNFIEAFTFFGAEFSVRSLDIILPVGISFYTFQTMSYTIDVYNKKLEPTKDFISFAAFVSFFPQLVAGPIERARNLLPQFYVHRTFDSHKAVDGLRQILWGLFKKIVIADQVSLIVVPFFDDPEAYNGSALFIGIVLYSFQVYCDFSGYTDIAIGTARLFGIELTQNFAFPLFSRDIAEFWRRWHISLSSWFRDYVYIPLGGNRGGKSNQVRNVILVFLISGFWHGASWNFIIWGSIHALLFVPLLIYDKNRTNLEIVAKGKIFPNFYEVTQIVFTFLLVAIAWIFFRSKDFSSSIAYFNILFSNTLFDYPNYLGLRKTLIISIWILFMLFIEWLGREHQYALEQFAIHRNKKWRYAFYYFLIFGIFWYSGKGLPFIYFQF